MNNNTSKSAFLRFLPYFFYDYSCANWYGSFVFTTINWWRPKTFANFPTQAEAHAHKHKLSYEWTENNRMPMWIDKDNRKLTLSVVIKPIVTVHNSIHTIKCLRHRKIIDMIRLYTIKLQDPLANWQANVAYLHRIFTEYFHQMDWMWEMYVDFSLILLLIWI